MTDGARSNLGVIAMSVVALIVVVSLAGVLAGSHYHMLHFGTYLQKHSSSRSLTLGDSYAKAAMLSLLSIESDVSTTEDRNGQTVVIGAGTTQSKIDEADAESRTKEEVFMTTLLRQLYKLKLGDNGIRKAEHNLFDAEIQNYSTYLKDHIITKEGMRESATKLDHDDAKISERETACFEPLKQVLRDRLSISPEPCTQWSSDFNTEPMKKYEQ